MDSLAGGKTWGSSHLRPFMANHCVYSLQSGLFERSLSQWQELTWKGTHYFHNRKSGGGAASRLRDSLEQFASSSGRGPTGCSADWHPAGGGKDHLFLRPPQRREKPVPEAHGRCSIGCHVLQVILSKGKSICLTSTRPIGFGQLL